MPVDPNAIDPNLLYTFREAAELAGVSRRTVEGWRARKVFEPVGGFRSKRKLLYIRGSDLLRIVRCEKEPPPVIESPAKRRRRLEAAEKAARELGI